MGVANDGKCRVCGNPAAVNSVSASGRIYYRSTCNAHRAVKKRANCLDCGNPRTGTSQTYCADCSASRRRERWSELSPEQRSARNRNYYLKQRYGITLAQEAEMKEAQGFRCGACGCDIRNQYAHIDHDHTTGAVRAILCVHCNPALAMAQEDPLRLRALADYIERYQVR